MRLQFVVPPEQDGGKLKNFIRSQGFSAGFWKKVKWHGRVSVNGVFIHNANEILREGSRVVCEWDDAPDIVPFSAPLSIVYEDEHLLVVNKPAHQLIHPTSRGAFDTLVNIIAAYYKENHIEAGIHPVYRLDRNTTGLVVVAKSSWVQHALSRSHDTIYREYIAIAEGRLTPEKGMLSAPIGRKEGSIVEWTVREDGKPAYTEYEVLAYHENVTVLRLHLLTGRTHQIRVHLSHRGHPLLGDDLYGGSVTDIARQALHAYSVAFTHPATGRKLTFTAPLPEDMKSFMKDVIL